jgi:hypothetical protein
MGNSWAPELRGAKGEIGPFILVYYTDRQKDHSDFFFFPVPPTDVQAQYGHTFSDFEVVGLGEAAMRGGDKLASLSLESFFPMQYDRTLVDGYYANAKLPKPYEFEQIIHQIRIIGRPCQLIIGGTNINWTCMIRDFRVEHRGGEPGDIYFGIDFKKHRLISVEKRKAGAAAGGSNRPTMSQGAPNIGKALAAARRVKGGW